MSATEYPVRLIGDDELPADVPWAVVRADEDGCVYVFVKESAGSTGAREALEAARGRYGPPALAV